MINPINVMKMLNERKAFIRNHPDFFEFIVTTFGDEVKEGTVIEVKIKKPGEETQGMDAKICKSDLPLLIALRNVIC